MALALAGGGWVLAAIVMALLWAWQLRTHNARIADAGWAGLVGGLALLYAVLGNGALQRRSAIASMMGSWGARLAVRILYGRVFGHGENARYARLRQSWGDDAPRRAFWLFQAYAACAVFFSLPALPASMNRAPNFSPLELSAAGLWIVAFTGETTAERQLEQFKSYWENLERTCRTGLWRFSRRVNYVFESLIWVAYVLFAWTSPWGWVVAACPAVMLVRLWKTGGRSPASVDDKE